MIMAELDPSKGQPHAPLDAARINKETLQKLGYTLPHDVIAVAPAFSAPEANSGPGSAQPGVFRACFVDRRDPRVGGLPQRQEIGVDAFRLHGIARQGRALLPNCRRASAPIGSTSTMLR